MEVLNLYVWQINNLYVNCHLAAIYLKNRIRSSWEVDEDNKKAVPISDGDRRGFKQNILNVLLNTPNNVR